MMVFMARNQFTPGTGSEISGKRLGIQAYGNVGRIVARYGKALGMKVCAFDPFVPADVFKADGVEVADSVEKLYASSDFLSLHIPATDQTRKSIGYKLLISMPKGATLVNTARKEVIDEAGLMQALEERPDLKYITDIAADAQPATGRKVRQTGFRNGEEDGSRDCRSECQRGACRRQSGG